MPQARTRTHAHTHTLAHTRARTHELAARAAGPYPHDLIVETGRLAVVLSIPVPGPRHGGMARPLGRAWAGWTAWSKSVSTGGTSTLDRATGKKQHTAQRSYFPSPSLGTRGSALIATTGSQLPRAMPSTCSLLAAACARKAFT